LEKYSPVCKLVKTKKLTLLSTRQKAKSLKLIIFKKRQNINFVRKKLDRCQNVQNFEPCNFDSIKFFDYLHGLAAKWIKPDDKLKN
jgi:hypothetical protein